MVAIYILIAVVSAGFFWVLMEALFPNENPVIKATYIEKEKKLTLYYQDGKVENFQGSGTVWYTYPMIQRCNSSTERYLCDIWTYIKRWGNDYPTAHLNQTNK
jgi:hypothetical protein